MEMSYEIYCSSCGKTSHDILNFKCPSCGQPLNVRLLFDFDKSSIQEDCYSAWRYAKSFPYIKPSEIVSLGEGWTPLVKFSDNVFFKLESLNPTGSFKDRGSTVLMSAINRSMRDSGLYVSEDSSGNAGASVAAYAARAGLRCRIYVPEAVSGPKFNQIRFYGADVVKVAGNRSRVTEEAQKKENGKTYVGHILHPVFRDGMRTFAYEIAEQFSWKLPERIYLPVSAGTLLLGMLAGFSHLAASGILKTYPKVVACQTRQVSPLYHLLNNLRYSPPEKVTSVADALVSINPPLLDLMMKELKYAQGEAVMVEEEEIIEAHKELALNGFFVEPSSAVAYAGYKKRVAAKKASRETSSLIILTGMGLKSAFQSFG